MTGITGGARETRSLKERWVAFLREKSLNTILSLVTGIQEAWLRELWRRVEGSVMSNPQARIAQVVENKAL